MIRPLVARLVLAGWLILAVVPAGLTRRPTPSPPPPRRRDRPRPVLPGRRADHQRVDRASSRPRPASSSTATRRRGKEPVLVFEFRPGEAGAGGVGVRGAWSSPSLISTGLSGAQAAGRLRPQAARRGTPSSPPSPATRSSWGPTARSARSPPKGRTSTPPSSASRSASWPIRKGYDPDLLLGMLDREADLRAVRTADKQLHFVFADEPPRVQEDAPGRRGRPGLGRGPARRPDRLAGPRDGLRQADRRQPGRGRQRLPPRRAVGRPTTRPWARSSSRSGSRSTGRSTRSSSRT